MHEDTEQRAEGSGDGLAKAIDPTKLGVGAPSTQLAKRTVFSIRGPHRVLRLLAGRQERRPSTSTRNMVTAVIGPSGCGKSTFIRCLNRMNDVIPGFRTEGTILYHDVDLHAKDVDPVAVRRRIGMVFQRPNPFPKSIFDNVAYGLRILGDEGQPQGPRRARAQAGGALGRGEGPAQGQRARPSPAASSSGSASRARSPSSPRSS